MLQQSELDHTVSAGTDVGDSKWSHTTELIPLYMGLLVEKGDNC